MVVGEGLRTHWLMGGNVIFNDGAEHGLATFDVFLSNFRRDNHATVRQVYQETLAFFEGDERTYAEVLR